MNFSSNKRTFRVRFGEGVVIVPEEKIQAAVEAAIKESIKSGEFLSDAVIADIAEQVADKIEVSVGDSPARIGEVTLLAGNWIGSESPYSQAVDIEGVTANSQVDLTPNVEQLAVFYNKDLTFVTENDGGIVTVYALGQKPQNDYTIQVTITEVTV